MTKLNIFVKPIAFGDKITELYLNIKRMYDS